MDVRDVGTLRSVAVTLERVNRLFWWDHNAHFHRWVIRAVSAHPVPMRVLDVGCGRGDLVEQLSERELAVIGIDPDPTMAKVAGDRFARSPTVTIEQTSFERFNQPVDVITMVASLHHQTLAGSFRHARHLLLPNGRLLVIGLAKSHSLTDLGYDVVASALNPLIGLTKKALGTNQQPPDMPMIDPTDSFDTIAAAARRELPGCHVRRRLFFRYTLEWTKRVTVD